MSAARVAVIGLALLALACEVEDRCRIGGMERCDEECPSECESVSSRARHCEPDLHVCVLTEGRLGFRFEALVNSIDRWVVDPDYVGVDYWCVSGEVLALTRAALAAPETVSPAWCVAEAYCDDPRIAEYDVVCIWSDGSVRNTHPTSSECPAGGDEDWPFCGGACGDCPTAPTGATGRVEPGLCVGRSDSRPIGVCSPPIHYEHHCVAGANPAAQCPDDAASCACLLFTAAPAVHDEHGWITSTEACEAYRALYPSDVRCNVLEHVERTPAD